MGTTPRGLPYPEPTDPVAGGADAIKALAQKIDPLTLAGAWTSLPCASGWLPSGAHQNMQYRIHGDMVDLRGTLSYGPAFPANVWTPLATLPVGFRPPANIMMTGLSVWSSPTVWILDIHTDGTIQCMSAQALAGTQSVFAIVGSFSTIAVAPTALDTELVAEG